MIHSLQKKFILTAMGAITILLLVLLGAINAVNLALTEHQTDQTLNMLSQNGGMIPPRDIQERKEPAFLGPPMNEDMAMAARYFTARIDQDGNVAYVDVSRISSITEEEAAALAEAAFRSGETEGAAGQFQYRTILSKDRPGSIVIFLDTTTQLYAMMTVLVISAGVGIGCWLLMFLLVVLLSKRAIRPIAQNIEKQRQFVTNAGHEIKTPLAIILTNTDAMELHNGENKWSRNIRAQTLRLNGLMQNLLTLAKMDESGTKLSTEEFSLSELLGGVLPAYEELTAMKQIKLRQYIQPDVMILANRDSIAQLVSILMDNAIKYTQEGGEMALTLQKRDKGAILETENSCENLPKGDPDRLFDRFYRGDSARNQKDGGYGIGLSAARAIVEANKGSIQAIYEGTERIKFIVKL